MGFVKKLFGGGGGGPSAPSYTPPPPREEIMDVIDKIGGVQSIVVTENGKKKRIIERLPRTPEDQAFHDYMGELMNKAVRNITQLYKYNPEDVVEFQPFIDVFANLNEESQNDLAEIANFGDITEQVQNFKKMNNELLEEQIYIRNRMAEENFAHRGISKSTAATEYRTASARQNDLARLQAKVDADMYGESLAEQRLRTNATAFGLREQGRQGRLQAAQTGYNLEQQKLQDLESKRQIAIQENQNLFNLGAGIRGEDEAKAMASRAPELANQTFAMMNADSLNRYNSGVNAQNAAFQNSLLAYQNRRPSFGDRLLKLGGMAAGAYLTGGMGGGMGGMGGGI
jgi:hypothetical protein